MRNPKQKGYTEIKAMLTSTTVQVLREEEAFSFESLVADCGGVLGLFVGFNFIMVWEWILFLIKIVSKYYNMLL